MDNSKQSKLEKIGIAYRDNTLVVQGQQVNAFSRNDYNKNVPYSDEHVDAHWDESNTSPDGKPLGKGTNSGGHTFSIPDQGLPTDLIVPQITLRTVVVATIFTVEGNSPAVVITS